MSKHFIRVATVGILTVFLYQGANAQNHDEQEKKKVTTNTNEEIVITRKGDKDTKVTVEIKGDEITINGKPLIEFKDDNLVIRKRNGDVFTSFTYSVPGSPFRRDSLFLNRNVINFSSSSNKTVLGISMDKGEKGVRVLKVLKESAAEKAGLKEDDIITRIGKTNVSTPEELTKALADFNPDDKVVITYLRGKKEDKVTAVLARRPEGLAETHGYSRNFDFTMPMPTPDALRRLGDLRERVVPGMPAPPRLGIKAQDTDDGKGVKVIEVDNESNAAKAGIRQNDIITDFDGTSVNSAPELATAARASKDKTEIKVKLKRDGKSQEVDIKIPKKLRTATL